MTTSAEKASLRTTMLLRRSGVGPEIRRDFATGLASSGLRLVGRFGTEPAVSVFLPIRDEPDTLPLIASLSEDGIRTALPVTGGRATPLRFLAWRPGEPTVRGRFGTEEPAATAPEIVPDVLFVPLAAFDRRGFRLGYGAGYYDSTLAELRRSKPVLAVGVAFSVQEVEAVPSEPHDERLDAVMTEHGLFTFGPDPCASSSSAT
jgi:5-formyltetrahydrofolate cyclo-ligase